MDTEIQREFEKLVAEYNSARSFQDLARRLGEIPLEVRAEVIEKFNAYLIGDALDFLSKSEYELHKGIHFSESEIAGLVKSFGDKEEFIDRLSHLSPKSKDIVLGSVDNYLKISNQIKLDTLAQRLENALFDKERFSLKNYEATLMEISPDIKEGVMSVLKERIELSVYQDRGMNNFSKEQVQEIGKINPKAAQLAALKMIGYESTFMMASKMVELDKKGELLLSPTTLNVDKNIIGVAEKAVALGVEASSIGEAQNKIVKAYFENAGIKPHVIEGQVDAGALFEAICNSDTRGFFDTKIARMGLDNEIHLSKNTYRIDFELNDGKIGGFHTQLSPDFAVVDKGEKTSLITEKMMYGLFENVGPVTNEDREEFKALAGRAEGVMTTELS